MIIGISGMISSGKSTLTQQLASHYPASQKLLEFEEDDEVFNTFLKWFYEQKENLSIGFQTYIIEAHSSKFNKLYQDYYAQNLDYQNNHIFLDRFSLEHYIFAKVNLKQKPEKYFKAYDLAFRTLINKEELPDFAIYLDMSFETFKERFFKRGRQVEVDQWDINQAYFYNLHKVYKEIFIQLCHEFNLKYFIIDTEGKNEDQVFVEAIVLIEKMATDSQKI
ncbi:deoxynucleoside kinase [Candidatus Mycoplasma pogonae]